jgi:glycosyltransferase involved in cell wall biosynthesis
VESKKIVYFFRKPDPDAHSIEEVFKQITTHVLQTYSVPISIKFMPRYSKSILDILKNLIYAYQNQGDVNHITGDIHYIALALSQKKTNILTIHDCRLLHLFPKNSLKFWIYKWFWLDTPIRFSTLVTSVSIKTKIDILDNIKCDESKIVVIPNPVNSQFSSKEYIFNKQNPRILQVGTGSNKNLERVIEALQGISCILEIIGNLSDTQKNLLIKNGIKYENHYDLPLSLVSKSYGKCDFVIFVSTFEGFGMPIIEANCSGKPLLTSNISPITEIAGNSALFVDPYNVESIRNGIQKIINDEALRKLLIEEGVKNAMRFSVDIIAQEYLSLYKIEPKS